MAAPDVIKCIRERVVSILLKGLISTGTNRPFLSCLVPLFQLKTSPHAKPFT